MYSILIFPITQIIECVFLFCKKLFNSTPLALIGISLAVSLLTLPLYVVAESWQQKERDKQKEMKHWVGKIKSAFKGNEQYMILSTYYRLEGYHPLMSLRSAFGLLIQIPFFAAAYSCLSTMEALKGETFWIIRDLGAPDAIFSLGNFNINILPLLMTAINLCASAIYLHGFPIRDKIQTYSLAFVFLILLYNSPSGLVIYWTMNNIFSLVKNVFYKFKHPVKILYFVSCGAVAFLTIWLIMMRKVKFSQASLIICIFSLVYFLPLFVKLCNYLIDTLLIELREDSKKRLSLFLFSCAALTFLLGLFIPTQLISSSPMEFSGIDGYGSPMYFVKNTFLQSLGLCFVWPVLIYFLFRERLQSLFSIGFFIFLVCSILNVFVFSGNYGTLSKLLKFTDTPNVDSTLTEIIINLSALIIISVGIIFLIKFKITKFYSYASLIVTIGIATFSLTNIHKINAGYADYKKVSTTESAESINPIFHFSKTGKNVLLIFLDRGANSYIEPMFAEDINLEQQFSGFTLYKNTISYNSHTLIGAPPCYGGYEYTPEEINKRSDEPLVSKHNESLLLLPRIFSEQAKNFSVTVTDPSWGNYSWIPDLSIYNEYPNINSYITIGTYLDLWNKNHSAKANLNITSETLKRNIFWYGLFKLSPYALRPAFYNDGNYWSTNKRNEDFYDYLGGYSVLEYLPKLTDFTEEKNSFISISNDATHESIFLQAPDYVPVSEVTNFGTSKYNYDNRYHSMMGVIKRIGEYFDYLKNENVYDNTRIIIYADHASGHYSDDFERSEKFDSIGPESYHPLLMVKDFGETGTLKINMDFMTNADVPVLAVSGIIEDPKNPFTGNKLDSSLKTDGALISVSDLFMPHHTRSKYIFTASNDSWWRVKDNIFKTENWQQEIKK